MEIKEFLNICRTCFGRDEVINDIFDIGINSVPFSEMIKECTTVDLTLEDYLPKQICKNCTDQIYNYYEFKKTILLTQNRLLNIWNTQVQLDSVIKSENSSDCETGDGNIENESVKSKVRLKSSKSTCEDCNIEFNSKKLYNIHVRQSHSNRKHKCDQCDKTFIVHGALLNHKLSHGFYCKVCFVNFNTNQELLDHEYQHKNLVGFVCKECGKEFSKKNKLKLHLRTHTGEKPHQCSVCGKAFALKGNLNAHMRLHNGMKPYACHVCTERFSQWTSLNSHIITHTNDKIHDCSKCGKKFSRKPVLKRHLEEVHAGIRQVRILIRKYPCSYCPKVFKISGDLRKHENIHTGEKKFVCTHCGKSFNRQSTLAVHIKIHTGERPHTCKICGRGFIQHHVLIRHLKTHKDI